MILFIVVMLTIGAFTAYFFGTDAALKTGLKAMDTWILIGLLIAILSPVFGIGRVLFTVIRKITHLFRRRAV
jgi:hypothetical protein